MTFSPEIEAILAGPDPPGRVFVELRRYGAAGGLEHQSASTESDPDQVLRFVALQLKTLGPLDRAEVAITRVLE